MLIFYTVGYFAYSDERPCRQYIMSITGFKGEERNRVKYMIELTGAKVTTYFSSDKVTESAEAPATADRTVSMAAEAVRSGRRKIYIFESEKNEMIIGLRRP